MLILKFKLGKESGNPVRVTMPASSFVLSAAQKYVLGEPCIFVSTDAQDSRCVARTFIYLATGQSYDNQYPMQFIGTIVDTNCAVWHVFEVLHDVDEVVAAPRDAQLMGVLETLGEI